jgi:hypothetical protein
MESKGKRSEPGDQKSQASAVWSSILKAGVRAQRLIPGAICVGGTASALYAGHRISLDTDHVLADLREHFDQVRAILEADQEWKTARVQPDVMLHRHIDTNTWTAAAIDSVLDRGDLPDWQNLFSEVSESLEVAERVLRVASRRSPDGASIVAIRLVERLHPELQKLQIPVVPHPAR